MAKSLVDCQTRRLDYYVAMNTSIKPSFEPDLKVILREQNRAHAARAAANFAPAVQPIYGANDRGDPDHIGSAVLLDIHGTKVMITAAHVIDENSSMRPTSLYVGGGANLELIESEFSITVAPQTMRKLDRYDIAFCALPPSLVEQLGAAYISLDEVARHAPDELARIMHRFDGYAALGGAIAGAFPFALAGGCAPPSPAASQSLGDKMFAG